MTDQERQMIEALAKRIQDAPAPQIDRDADDLIHRTIGARTDALYILTQTVLIQEMALSQAKAQIDELKQRVASAGDSSSGFLGSRPLSVGPKPADGGTKAGFNSRADIAVQVIRNPATKSHQFLPRSMRHLHPNRREEERSPVFCGMQQLLPRVWWRVNWRFRV